MEQKVLTRQEYKQEEQKQKTKPQRKIKVRLLPIWLRFVIVVALIAFMVIIGAIIGYSVFGGGSFIDVFKLSTWTHIGDIVNKGAK